MKKQNKISSGAKIEINNQADYKIDLKLVRKVVNAFYRVYRINNNQEISLAFVSDAEIRKINNTYRGLNQATDVLSFAGDGDLGEIIIDYDQIKRQAADFNNSGREELIFILAHGLLHLIGYDDKTEQERLEMIRLGEEFMRKFKM